MSIPAQEIMNDTLPAFTQGIKHFAPETSELQQFGQSAVIGEGNSAIAGIDDVAVYQTQRAGGGPAVKTVVAEFELELPEFGELPKQEFAIGDKAVPSTAMGALVGEVGKRDPRFVVANADGNEASAMKNINEALQIRHPTQDALYNQGPEGQVYEPLSEDACAGFAGGLACRDVMCWKRGETTASPGEIMAFNGLSADDIIARVNRLAGALRP